MITIFIILLILLGTVLVIAEILLLPGITLAAIGAICSFGCSIYLSYVNFGMTTAILIVILSIVLSIVALIYSLKAKSIKKISLESKVDSSVAENLQKSIKIGTIGVTSTRLAPMGSVKIDRSIYEAKSVDGFINPKCNIVVAGFENNILIVEKSDI